jgi:hypothetical protein
MLLVCVDFPLSSYKKLPRQKRSRQLRFISPSPVILNWCKRVMQAFGQIVDPNLSLRRPEGPHQQAEAASGRQAEEQCVLPCDRVIPWAAAIVWLLYSWRDFTQNPPFKIAKGQTDGANLRYGLISEANRY